MGFNWGIYKMLLLGSGCGSVGKAVGTDSWGPQFKSSHREQFILHIYCKLYWKDKNKEKEAGNGPFKKSWSFTSLLSFVDWHLIQLFRPETWRNECSKKFRFLFICLLQQWRKNVNTRQVLKTVAISVTRLGDLLDFGQLFKACGNN